MNSLTSRWTGVAVSMALTGVVALTAGALGQFHIHGPTVPFAYPWRLTEPTFLSHLTAWVGYSLHNLGAWLILFWASRSKPGYSDGFRRHNWAMLGLHGVFITAHQLQTHYFYDGLAQDVPEITALGSVALMLMVVLLLDAPRRGLFFGKRMKLPQRLVAILRTYHGYLFSWAIIYDFWYHPLEGTSGHLAGFFYIYLLLWQSALMFTRAHVNRTWTLFLEFLVLPHGVAVAVYQGNRLWPMFAFGFGAVFVLTQMHGLKLPEWAKRSIYVGFILLAVVTYSLMGRLEKLHEITRIPVLDYGVVGLLYGLYLLGDWGVRKLRPGDVKPLAQGGG